MTEPRSRGRAPTARRGGYADPTGPRHSAGSPSRQRHPADSDTGFYTELGYGELGDEELGYEPRWPRRAGRDARRPPVPAGRSVAAPPPVGRGGGRGGKNRVDAWMEGEFTFAGWIIRRQTAVLFFLRLPALVPLFFMLPALVTGDSNTFAVAVDDVLGTGAEFCLFICLLVTPMITLTRQHWFTPLRRWYGILFMCCAIGDATAAAITDDFSGGVVGRIAGHTFTLVGLLMVMIGIPLLLTGNTWAQRRLGKHWKQLQRLTYLIWGLLFFHLATLEGFGFQHGANGSGHAGDGDPVFHQRLYQYAACSLFLLTLRLPPIKRWIATQQKNGHTTRVWLAILPLATLFILFFAFIINEEIFKGIDAFTLHPSNE